MIVNLTYNVGRVDISAHIILKRVVVTHIPAHVELHRIYLTWSILSWWRECSDLKLQVDLQNCITSLCIEHVGSYFEKQ
jgi:hypothetical protein